MSLDFVRAVLLDNAGCGGERIENWKRSAI